MMNGTKTETNQSPQQQRDTTVFCLEKVDVRVNTDIFTLNGNVKKQAEIENKWLLSFKWPAETKIIAFTSWTPEVTTRVSQRKQEFAEATVVELGLQKWEMVKSVMQSLYQQFGACLLEVSFWAIRLGHRDLGSARKVWDSKASVTSLLKYLLADTEYLFRDIQVQWSFSSEPDLDHLQHTTGTVQVQESSILDSQNELSNSNLSDDGPGSLLSCVCRCNSGEQQKQDRPDVDEKQMLIQLLKDMNQIRRLVSGMEQKVGNLEQKVDENHKDLCVMLEEARALQAQSDLLGPPNQAMSQNISSHVRLRANVEEHDVARRNRTAQRRDHGISQVTSHRPQQDQHRQNDRAPNSKREQLSNGSECRSDATTTSNEQPAGIQQSGAPKLSDQSNGAPNKSLIAEDNNIARRGGGVPAIKSNSRNDRNNYSVESRNPSVTATDRNNITPVNQTTSSSSLNNTTRSNIPSASKLQSSVRHQQPSAGRQLSDQQSSEGEQFPSHSSTTLVTNSAASGGAKNESLQQQQQQQQKKNRQSSMDSSPFPENSSQSSSSRHKHGAGRGSGEHQKQAFTAEGMGMGTSGGRYSKSDEGGMTLLVQSSTEGRLVRESVERAYCEDAIKPPKSKSFDTMLCLDISESMKEGRAFEQMKRTVLQFIEGVEDLVTQTGVEENMGLVTFGGRANVVQNLTNDFNLIRDKIDLMEPGGNSPFVEALLVAMAAFVNKGGIVSISREWQVKPRIIFISDGMPTESSEVADFDIAHNLGNVRLSLSNVLMSFKNKDSKHNNVHPVFFVPVGEKADKNYMRTMSTICGGEYVEPGNIQRLCNYFRVQETIGKVLCCLKRQTEDLSPQKIEATMMALTPDLSDQEKQEALEVVEKELDNPTRAQHTNRAKPDDLDHVYEDADKVNEGKRLPLGTRVIQGPDWKFGNQDEGGPGTVIGHDSRHSTHWVYWDAGGNNCYLYSNNNGYHIWKTEDHPRLRNGNEPLAIGMTVKKGKDWKPVEGLKEQGQGRGVIVRRSNSSLMVRWSNGVFQKCIWSSFGTQEVDYCPPLEENFVHQHPSQNPAPQQDQSEWLSSSFEGQGMWQWCDVNNIWHPYEEKINKQIEAACKKENPRSCIISRNEKQCRIMFRRMVEKVVSDGTECKIRRLQSAT